MNSPLVYVIVINWNGREHLEACFDALLQTTYGNARFLLVDNASTDDSPAFVRERFGSDPRVEVLELPENRGWSGGNNAGIVHARKAGAAYLFLLNNDTATAGDAIGALVGRMEADPALGGLAPRMVLFDQPDILNSTGLQLSPIGAAWDIGIGRQDGPEWRQAAPIAGICGGAMFLRAGVLDHTGLFPEDFEIYLDDLDLCLRIWSAGYTIEQCAEAVVRHKFSATMGEGKRARHKYYLNTRNRFRIVLRHFPAKAAGTIVPRLVLGEVRALGRAVRSGVWWRIPAHLRAWASAAAYLPGALQFRRANAAGGNPPFWPLVVNRPLFCPAVVLPDRGWYPPIKHDGEEVRPMARRAWLDVPAGTLQVSLVNCYPARGEARIALYLDETPLGELVAAEYAGAAYKIEAGTLTIVAESIFKREESGGVLDAGAWMRLSCNGTRLV